MGSRREAATTSCWKPCSTTLWYAIDMHNEYDELREPDEFDDAQLLEVMTGYLADWDAGTWQPDPRWARE